jgi:hypothetical protein
LSQSKAKKVGRPKLPKGEAKGRIVPVRFTAEDLRAIEASAKATKQTVSQWVRSSVLMTPLQAFCNTCQKTVAAHTLLSGRELRSALANKNEEIKIMHTASEGDHIWTLREQDKKKLSNAIAKGFI